MNLVTITNLEKRFSSEQAVKGISFSIKQGRCLALIGPNGAGKTTTIRMLAGMLQPSAGQILFEGLPNAVDRRQHIGYLPQYPAFYGWMSGKEYLIYAGQLAQLSKQKAKGQAEKWLDRVGLKEFARKRIAGYSGGMKQRLGLAQAMLHEPKLLILDEPVSALDPVGRREVLEMMRELKKETTLLFSTHVLHDAEQVSDDIVILNKGEIHSQGSLESLRHEHQQPILLVRFDSEAEAQKHEQAWQQHEWVEQLERQGDQLLLAARSISETREWLLEEIVSQHIPILRFEVKQASLEELFLKAVAK